MLRLLGDQSSSHLRLLPFAPNIRKRLSRGRLPRREPTQEENFGVVEEGRDELMTWRQDVTSSNGSNNFIN